MSTLHFGTAANPLKIESFQPDDILENLFGLEGVPANRTVFTTICALRDYHAFDLSENADRKIFSALKNHIELRCALFHHYKKELPLNQEDGLVLSAWLLERYYTIAPKADSWRIIDPNVKDILDFIDEPENNMLVMGDILTRENIFDHKAAGQALLIGLINLVRFGNAMGNYEKNGINRTDPEERRNFDHEIIHAMRILTDKLDIQTQLFTDCQEVAYQLVRFSHHLPGARNGQHLRLV